MQRSRRLRFPAPAPRWIAAPALLLAVLGARSAHPASAAPGPGVTVTGVRSWPAPANTRVVFDFTGEVTLVAPDSGVTRELAVTVPGISVGRGSAVPEILAVADGVVDSVEIATGDFGARFHLWFRDTTSFRVFTLAPEEDKPFRVVVDVARPGARSR